MFIFTHFLEKEHFNVNQFKKKHIWPKWIESNFSMKFPKFVLLLITYASILSDKMSACEVWESCLISSACFFKKTKWVDPLPFECWFTLWKKNTALSILVCEYNQWEMLTKWKWERMLSNFDGWKEENLCRELKLV